MKEVKAVVFIKKEKKSKRKKKCNNTHQLFGIASLLKVKKKQLEKSFYPVNEALGSKANVIFLPFL